jgi:hypothetical protein
MPGWAFTVFGTSYRITNIVADVAAGTLIKIFKLRVHIKASPTGTTGTILIQTYKGLEVAFNAQIASNTNHYPHWLVDEATIAYTIDSSMVGLTADKFMPYYQGLLT